MKRSRSAGVPFILVVLFLDTLGIGVVIPVLPRLLESFLGGNLSATSYSFGAFIGLYAMMQFVFAPIIGALSDRFGRRIVILTSLLGAGLDYLLLAFAPSLAWLFVGRLIAGITGASYAAGTAYITDVTPSEKRAASFGLMGAVFGLGFILGPAVGGLLGDVHLRAPFVVAAGLNLVNFLYGLFVLPESLAPEHRRPFSLERANPLGALKNLARSPTLLGLTGTIVCAYLAQQILASVWALDTTARFGWNMGRVGVSLTVVGVSSALVQGWLVRLIVPRLGERRALIVGLLVTVLGFCGFALATKGWMMYVIIFPFALGGIGGPATQAMLSREVGPSEQGELQGSLASLNSMTAIVGPLAGAALLARFAPSTAVPHIDGAPYYASAFLNLIGLALAVRLFARMKAGVA